MAPKNDHSFTHYQDASKSENVMIPIIQIQSIWHCDDLDASESFQHAELRMGLWISNYIYTGRWISMDFNNFLWIPWSFFGFP